MLVRAFKIAASLPVANRRDFAEDTHRTSHCRKEGIAPEYLPYYRDAPPIGGGALKVTSTSSAPLRLAQTLLVSGHAAVRTDPSRPLWAAPHGGRVKPYSLEQIRA